MDHLIPDTRTLDDFRKACSKKFGFNCSKVFEMEAWLADVQGFMGPNRELCDDWFEMIENASTDGNSVYVLHLSGPDRAVIEHYADCSDRTEVLAVSSDVDELVDYAGFCPDTSCRQSLWCPFIGSLDDAFNEAKARYENFSHGDSKWHR